VHFILAHADYTARSLWSSNVEYSLASSVVLMAQQT